MRNRFLMSAFAASLCGLSSPAAAQDEPSAHFSIEASVAYALQHVKDAGTYHSVLVSPQATFYWGESNGSGPFITLGDALFSSIIGGPSDASPSDATKLNGSQVYAQVGYRFHIIEPATKLNIGIGYLNQRIDAASDKYGHGPFFSISLSVPVLDVKLKP